MEKIGKFLEKLIITLILSVFFSLIIFLAVFTGILFAVQGVFWVTGFSTFFLLFHIGDIIRYFKDGNFIGAVGRLICIYGLASFICGFIAYASGAYFIESGFYTDFALYFSLLFSIITVPAYFITTKYFKNSRFHRYFKQIYEGLFALGILWRY